MGEQQNDRERALRFKAAQAFAYERPASAKKPMIDTSRLWTSASGPVDTGKPLPDVPRDSNGTK